MRELKRPSHGGMYLRRGIPDDYYAFTDGQLSLTVERNGGVNTLNVLDILEHGGKLYPDRLPSPPVFLREGNCCGKRPLYGPGLRFISTNKKLPGERHPRQLFHCPKALEVYPCGFKGDDAELEYDLCVDGLDVLFRLANHSPSRDLLLVAINKGHIVNGRLGTCKNQVSGSAGPTLDWTPGLDPDSPDPDYPFPDSKEMTLAWDFIGFRQEEQLFRMDGSMAFAYGVKPVSVAIACDRAMTMRETTTTYILEIPWGKEEEISLCLSLDGPEEARRRCKQAAELMDRKFAAVRALRGVELVCQDRRIGQFTRTLGAFEQSMVLAETESQACIRAAMHKYGFFAMWDQLCPAKSFLLQGDFQTAAKLVRYMADYPHVATCFWTTTQIVLQAAEVFAFSRDRSWLEEVFPFLERFFHIAARAADPETGLVAVKLPSSVDDPAELGIEGPCWAPCVNGWWHGACRALANLALLLDKPALADEAARQAAKVEASYLPVFFDEAEGYLYCAVNPKTRKGAGIFHNTSTLAMAYPYGARLFQGKLADLAEYQARRLSHPTGRSAVAFDSDADEMWKNAKMFQHLNHEAKLARAAGLPEEARGLVDTYMNLFERFKVGMETHNISGCEGDCSQRGNWQAFGAQSALSAMVEGLVGIQWDLGGFRYVPCDMGEEMGVKRFRFRDATWDVEVAGSGPYALLDFAGAPLHGSLQVPSELLGGSKLLVKRSAEPFSRPTLLEALDAEICGLESSAERLAFGVAAAVNTSVSVYCPAKPRLTVNGKPQAFEWDATNKTLRFDRLLGKDDLVEVWT